MSDQQAHVPEVDRILGEDDWPTQCICGAPITLYFNGGELDQTTCRNCGRTHRLDIASIRYSIRR